MTAPVTLLAAIPQPAFLCDHDGTIVEANGRAEALAGRPLAGRTAAAVVGIFNIRAPDGTPLMAAELPPARALAGEETVDVPLVVTAADGGTLHVLASAAPFRDEDGLAGALWIWQDVSRLVRDRAEAETVAEEIGVQEEELRQQGDELVRTFNELERQRRLLDGVLGALPHQVSVWDRDDRLVWANLRFAAERGPPLEALVGRTWREVWGDSPMAGLLVGEGGRGMAEGVPFDIAGPTGQSWRACPFVPIFGDSRLVITEDVTARRRAEEALIAERNFSDAVIETAGSLIVILDRKGRIVRFNRACQEKTGYALEDAVGRAVWDFLLAEEAKPGVIEVFNRLEAGWFPIEYENDWVARNGEAVSVSWMSTAILGSDGAVEYVVAIGTDVTERRRAEEALRESEARYRRLVDDDISGDFIAALDGRLLDCNPAFARMFGFASVDEARSSNIVETYLSPGEREAVLDRLRREGRLERDERFRRRRDGALIHVVENIVGDFDDAGNLVEIRGYTSEDTQRHLAEEALRESEERLRLAQESATIAIWDWNVRTGGLTYTPELLLIYGIEEGRITTYDEWRAYVHPDDLERVDAERMAALARGERYSLEYRILRPSGEVRWIAAAGRGYSDASGDLVRVLGVNLDVTERKTAELAQARSAERLRQSNEELQRFAYVASHDLQEPLRSIISFTQLLDRRYRGKLDQDADEYIAFIVEGGTRMQRLIEDLLQLSRVETTARPLEPTDAGEVVADALRLMETSVREAGATVEVGELPTVMADAAQLAQVFSNLVGNALKYRREGVAPLVRISAERSGEFWRFAVADNGIGIEEGYFDRIFIIFQRLHTRDVYAGTGIGLAVVRKIVERHGGKVWVESVPGEGSTFLFTLPAA